MTIFWKLIVLLSSFQIIDVVCKELPNISLELTNSGFHRELYYGIQFEKLSESYCEYFLEQHLPASVYVNVDQLEDLVRFEKLNAIYPSHVDVEIPTEKAQSFSVLLHVAQKSYQAINLPIHFRYHAPGDKSFVRVHLENPLLYMKCTDNTHIPKDTEITQYCIKDSRFIPYDNKSSENCNWIQMDYNIYLKTPLKVNIPIGDARLAQPVTLITILVSWIGCACILFTTYNKMRIIRKKLK